MRYCFIIILGILMLGLNSCAQTTPISPLEYLVQLPKVETEQTPVLILLHGLGSNEKDLFSLAPMIDQRMMVVAPRAPKPYANGYSWFQMDFSGAEEPIADPKEALEAQAQLLQFVDYLIEKHGVDPKRVYLMGFSQGAMLSFSVALSQPDRLAGIAAFSGKLMKGSSQELHSAKDYEHLRVYLAHGTMDQVLQYKYALEVKKRLDQLQISTTFNSYQDAHTISQANLRAFLQWMKQQLDRE